MLCLARGSRELAKTHCHWNRQDVDLSYLNGPDINAMVLQGGYNDIHGHYQAWSHLLPPEECLQKLFVTKDGMSIQQQIDVLVEVGIGHGASRRFS